MIKLCIIFIIINGQLIPSRDNKITNLIIDIKLKSIKQKVKVNYMKNDIFNKLI